LLFRYPGGKEKLSNRIIGAILKHIGLSHTPIEYREPFFGAGGIGFGIMRSHYVSDLWINDADPAISAVWNATLYKPKELCQAIDQFKPSVELFFALKKELSELTMGTAIDESVDVAAKKIGIHQISYSGLGTKAGGPIGGKDQSSQYDVECRWNATSRKAEVWKTHKLLKSKNLRGERCSCLDFEDILLEDRESIWYLDPPYYQMGNDLYQYGFTEADHIRLRDTLQFAVAPWLLSYDACEEIQCMYRWAEIMEVPIKCTINGVIEKNEYLIAPKRFKYLLESPRSVDLFEN